MWDTLAWRSAVRAGDQALRRHPERFVRTRYEELVIDPEAEVARICQFLGLEYDPAMIQVNQHDSAYKVARTGSGISTASTERWREVLSQADVGLCQLVAGETLSALDYPAEPMSAPDWVGVPPLLLNATMDLFVRLGRKWRAHGGWHVKATLLGYVEWGKSLVRP